MSFIYYPAIFHKEEDSYWVEFPDLEGCFSKGTTLEDAFNNAKEALGLYLDTSNDIYDRKINKPSKIMDIIESNKDEEGLILFVGYDSIEYGKKYKNKAIKKTLSIPEWLNDIAVKNNVNFSNVLQEALIEKLKLK